MNMNEEVFQECLKMWKDSAGNSSTSFWDELAEKHQYSSSESLRSQFKRERKRRGITKTDRRTVQQNPVVAVLDVETLPLEIGGHMWRVHDQYVSPKMIKRNWALLSWAGKYLHDSEVHSDVLTAKEAPKYDSHRITKSIWEFMNSADIIIWHNGNHFDAGIINVELTRYDLPPLKYRTVDTYQLIKANYTLPSYSLGYVNSLFGIRDKIENDGMPLWERCVDGDQSSLDEMLSYNEGDVLANEDLFWKIQPYCNNSLPNFGTYQENATSQMCQCGSYSFVEDGFWRTQQAMYERKRCKNCGAVHRGRKNILSKDVSKNLMVRL